jgi:hypothetical protein
MTTYDKFRAAGDKGGRVMASKFCVWYDGPVVEAWAVYFLRGKQTAVYCHEPATEAEVREHATRLYAAAYGPVGGITRCERVPSYCADRPAVVCPT